MTAAFIFSLFKVRDSVVRQFSQKIESLALSVDTVKTNFNDSAERIRKEAGESYSALRTKVHEVEMEALRLEKDIFRDFVRRESFKEGMDRMEKSVGEGLRDLKSDLKVGLDGLDKKITDFTTHGKKL